MTNTHQPNESAWRLRTYGGSELLQIRASVDDLAHRFDVLEDDGAADAVRAEAARLGVNLADYIDAFHARRRELRAEEAAAVMVDLRAVIDGATAAVAARHAVPITETPPTRPGPAPRRRAGMAWLRRRRGGRA